MLTPEDLDVELEIPAELVRVVEQDLMNLAPWRIMPRELALRGCAGSGKDTQRDMCPLLVGRTQTTWHALSRLGPARWRSSTTSRAQGRELRNRFPSFWDWFRAAVEDMISFE